jgi:HTH-type transcriptional regulator/antitoxin HigA
MRTEERYFYKPNYAVHPGEYIEEVLEAREITQKDLAERIGISAKHLNQIVNKQAPVHSELALQLERALGVSANIWHNMNAAYYLFQARQNEAVELKTQYSWTKQFPVGELIRIGLLPQAKKPGIVLENLLNFFNVSHPDNWDKHYKVAAETNFRKSPTFKDDLPHLISWLRVGELRADQIDTKPYSKDVFKENLKRIRAMAVQSSQEFYRDMQLLCAEAGVALVCVPEFKKTHVSGATRWLTAEKAVIMLSLRHKSNDHFWFTFFHEAAHILLHAKKGVFIDDVKGFQSDEEEEANRFSRNMLIPEAEYAAFSRQTVMTETAVKAFAKKVDIHPGIVVGRLQHDKRIHYGRLNSLKVKYDFGF